MSGSRSDARRPAGGAGGCAIHLVRFSAYSEGGCPVAGGGGLAATMADLLVALGPGGCGREVATPGFGHEQVALPVEDVIVTSNHTLFDQDGYLTRVCAMHAEFLRLHAVAPRACHGPQCRNRAAPGLAQARRVSGFGSGEDPDGVGLCRRCMAVLNLRPGPPSSRSGGAPTTLPAPTLWTAASSQHGGAQLEDETKEPAESWSQVAQRSRKGRGGGVTLPPSPPRQPPARSSASRGSCRETVR